MSHFEIIMLICFGASWPLSIAKTIKAKNPTGKSIGFLYLVFVGYASGCFHKMIFNFDHVIWLYILNGVMVGVDIILVHYYINQSKKQKLKQQDVQG